MGARLEVPQGDSVHVWAMRLSRGWSRLVPSSEALLDHAEIVRAERMTSVSGRERYVVAHAFTRMVLSSYLDIAMPCIPIKYESMGKPVLGRVSGRRKPLEFSIAHSGDLVVVAVAGRRVGVDVERVKRGFDYLRIVQRFFHPSEIKCIAMTTPRLRRNTFYRMWTRKEALVKGIGTGMFRELRCLPVPVSDAGHGARVGVKRGSRHDTWYLSDISCGREYRGSVALKSKSCRICMRSMTTREASRLFTGTRGLQHAS